LTTARERQGIVVCPHKDDMRCC